jgi:hypothetical protein
LICSLLAPHGVLRAQGSSAPGGFVVSATSGDFRPQLSPGEIASFLPARGPFRFPAPYSTQGVRLTNGSDCGGADCVSPVGYSYWRNINNHAGRDTMLMFLGLERRKGGGGPTLFSYEKATGATRNLGPLFSADSPYSWSTGEGWYFSATQPNTLYLNDGPRMRRYDVQTRALSTVYDVSDQFGADKYIWQMHSSNDDRVHSATLRRDGTYEMLGCVVYQQGASARFFPKVGDFDECQIDKSGRWLVIKENVDGVHQEDNRVIDLQTGTERVLFDHNGAAGHSDIGYGYMLAEDNFNNQPGAVRLWNFGMDMQGGEPVASVPGQGVLIYQLTSWASGLGHIAHGNARSGDPSGQMACSSNANRVALSRVNEVVCYRLNDSLSTLVVAPNMIDLNASGGGSDDYSKMPKGNLDVTGEYFIWTANTGTNRLDAFVVRIPQAKLAAGGTSAPPPTSDPAPAPAPTPVPSPPAPSGSSSAGEPVRWTGLVNASANGGTLQKTGGCSGCADAGAVSEQQITSGGVEFAASDANLLRFVGLGAGGTGTGAAEIRFALRLQGGVAEVREAGIYKAEIRFAAGDVFRIAVDGGTVKYSKSGSVFYSSADRVESPLRVDTSLYDAGAAVNNATITR